MHDANGFAMLVAMSVPTSHQIILVLVAGVIQWLLGALWYGLIFKKSWRTLVGLAEGEKPKNAVFGMVTSLIACLLLSFVLVHIIAWAGAMTFTDGFKLGVVCWVGFMAPPLFAQHIFEGRRVNLFAINAGYWLLAMAIGGAIMGAFHS
jgi:hypothetical protein